VHTNAYTHAGACAALCAAQLFCPHQFQEVSVLAHKSMGVSITRNFHHLRRIEAVIPEAGAVAGTKTLSELVVRSPHDGFAFLFCPPEIVGLQALR